MGTSLQPPFVHATVIMVASAKRVDQDRAQRRLLKVFRLGGPIFIILGLIGLASTAFLPHKPSAPDIICAWKRLA